MNSEVGNQLFYSHKSNNRYYMQYNREWEEVYVMYDLNF